MCGVIALEPQQRGMKSSASKSALIAGPCQGQVAAESESGICQAALEGMGADSVTYYEYL